MRTRLHFVTSLLRAPVIRLLPVAVFILFFPAVLRAGGPAFIAGAGYDVGVEGQPLVWASATVNYYTDQGSLSPILTNAQADALVAAAVAPWISAPGVGLTVTQSGHLAEDVSGSNIQVSDGVITAPADITPSATGTPLGIIYDYDGTVTDALLGQGAGDAADCFTNAVYGGPDNFSAAGNIVHALAVINGVCAASTAQLPDVQYRLVRVLARIFGLGWSQANLNVITNNPPPTQADFQGFPLMHFLDPITCAPITICYGGIFGGALGGGTFTPALDDSTALAALYPAPSGGPQPTGGLNGIAYFTDASGNAAQMMQGVNIVARLLISGEPSRQYVVSSVSGFPFVGNAGNIVTGYLNSSGLPYNAFGSANAALEGQFNFGQLMIPSGQTSAQYQLAVEGLDPQWSRGVIPYAPMQVTPSGSFAPVVVTISQGTSSQSDILMRASEIAQPDAGTGSTYLNPNAIPEPGGWGAWISPYAATDFFQFTAQANRTASVAVTALDEFGNPTEFKVQPVIGIWELSDLSGDPAPASTSSPFNTLSFGLTRLDAQFNSTEPYRIGIADFRGDGRPDYFYQASVLYSDSVTPARLSLAGGDAALTGIGFRSGLQVTSNSDPAAVLSQSSTEMQVAFPAATQDGPATIQVTDPVTGSFSQMIGALTFGAAPTDLLFLVQGAEPATPVGSQAANPIRVRATASDEVTPINGATIAWSSTNGIQFSVCGGAISCSVLTDSSGEASTWVTPTATGPGLITAQLAPLSYSPPQTQQTTLVGTSTSLDLAAVDPNLWIAQGATVALPLTVQALDLGVPQSGISIKFSVTIGSFSLSSGSATTNSSGLATVTAQLTNFPATSQVVACVSPAGTPCQTFSLFAVPLSLWHLEAVSGTAQIVPNGQAFQPLVMRVTDGSSADNPVIGATVTFITTLERNPQGPTGPPPGDNFPGPNPMPVILGMFQTQVSTDLNGLASVTPTVGSQGPCDVFISVTAGSASAQFELQSVDPLSVAEPPRQSPAAPPVRFVPPWVAPPIRPPQNPPATFFAIPQAMPSPDLSPNVCALSADAGCDANPAPGSPPSLDNTPPVVAPANLNSVNTTGKVEEPSGLSSPTPKGNTVRPLPVPGFVLFETSAEATSALASRPPQNGPPPDLPDRIMPHSAADQSRIDSSLLEDKRTCRFAQVE